MFTMEFDTSGDGFWWNDNPGFEVAEVLRNVATRLVIGQTEGTVLDANGNKCGTWKLKLAE